MRNPRLLELMAGPLGALLVAMMNTPEGLTLAGQRALAVLVLCVIWWVFTPVGLPVTSIMGLALLPMAPFRPPGPAVRQPGRFFVIACSWSQPS